MYNDTSFNITSTDALYFNKFNQGILESEAIDITWERASSALNNAAIFGGSLP
jgi:hypothetical protein